MFIQRIRYYSSASSYPVSRAERAARDEHKTLLEDAIMFDTEQRDRRQDKQQESAEKDASKEDAGGLGATAKEPSPLDIVA